MAHFPVNHHLQPLYRVLAGLAGAYVLAFGITALVRTREIPWFAQRGLPSALGLHANRAFAVLSIVVGLILFVGAIIGGNLDRWINLIAGVVFLVAGMAMMILMQTSFDYLGFTMATCIVSFVIGLLLSLAGLYGRVGTVEDVECEERHRHGAGPDTQQHRLLPHAYG
jgi:Domain of unknown function (DUF4383)